MAKKKEVSKQNETAPAVASSEASSGAASSQPTSCPVAGIGASAGGMEAFTELLQHLPNDTGIAFVLIQHLDPKHNSLLTELLGRATSMP
ncbi:MAG TPA: chemotaxis protein CheB, partial [Candidatus Solibacter sp.]|nr:chemotaxis protein CheB [Candidatus Solibacter sp.]